MQYQNFKKMTKYIKTIVNELRTLFIDFSLYLSYMVYIVA